jgi:hypothetical protein
MGFPSDPEKRRVIVPLTESESVRANDNRDLRSLLAGRGVAMLRLPVDADPKAAGSPVVQALSAAGLVENRVVLVQSPLRPERYVPAHDAADALAREKYMLGVRLYQRLGARRVAIEEVERVTDGHSISLRMSGTHNGLGAGGSVEYARLTELMRSIEMSHEFAGGEPNLNAARALLLGVGLSDDLHLGGLVEMRHEDNALLRQRVKVGTARENERIRGWLGEALVPLNRIVFGGSTSALGSTNYTFVFDVQFRGPAQTSCRRGPDAALAQCG